MKTSALALLVFALPGPLSAQWLTQPTPGIPRTADGKPNIAAAAPRTPDGRPDLSGIWRRVSHTVSAPLRPGSPSVDALVRARGEDYGKNNMTMLCLPLGPRYITAPGLDPNVAGMMKLVQTPLLIIMLNSDLTYRQIFLDGRRLESEPNPNWMGYSVGRWEGDTLVVESNGFNDRTWLDDFYPHTEALRAVERYRRTAFGRLELEVTLEDPTLYATPFRATVGAQLTADTEMLEYVCNENTTPREHWVGRRSDDERSAVSIPSTVLERYAGEYVEQKPYWGRTLGPRIFEITFADGALFVERTGDFASAPGKLRLTAQSSTLFNLAGPPIEFILDDQGTPTGLLQKQVSGDYKFERTK